MKAFQVGTNKLLHEKLIEDCFTKKIVDKSLDLVEITNNSRCISVSYFVDKEPKLLRILDIKIGESGYDQTLKFINKILGNE